MAENYLRIMINKKRILNCFAVILSIVLLLINGLYVIKFFPKFGTPSKNIFCGLCGVLTADFLSGVLHWIADTWGSTDLPVVGENFLKPFREHHVDPTSITRHDFVETNSYNFAVLIPFLANMLRKFWSKNVDEIGTEYNWTLFTFWLGLFVAYTNQIHKWSHTYHGLPKYITLMQKYHLILPQKQHRYHHIAPHETYYCITTGWLNYPLEYISFWSTLEKLITKVTGYRPRTDDLRWAKKIRQKREVEQKSDDVQT